MTAKINFLEMFSRHMRIRLYGTADMHRRNLLVGLGEYCEPTADILSRYVFAHEGARTVLASLKEIHRMCIAHIAAKSAGAEPEYPHQKIHSILTGESVIGEYIPSEGLLVLSGELMEEAEGLPDIIRKGYQDIPLHQGRKGNAFLTTVAPWDSEASKAEFIKQQYILDSQGVQRLKAHQGDMVKLKSLVERGESVEEMLELL